jgi:UDP-4-amino-4,6-dideoxy-N-acetyl-beta-L-altrosamine transaminase
MKKIPYGHQWIDQSDIEEVVKVLKSDWLTQGPKVKEFEDALCKYTGAKYAVAVSSGTAALHLACLAAGTKEGDEAITSPITFMASSNSILYCGGKPVFIDIEPDTGNIDSKKIKNYLNSQPQSKPKPKAIIPVHYAGHPCDMEAIHDIAKENNLVVIEDAAHALGASYKGDKIGSCKYSDMATFSFHPVKSITTGEGGAITTNNKEYYQKLIMLRQHGITKAPKKFLNPYHLSHNPGSWYHEMQLLGFNYRITDFQSALGTSQLKKLNGFIERRREIAGIYDDAFKDNEFFDLPIEKDYAKSSWHLYPIRLKDKYKDKKILIFNKLREKGLGVQVHYIPVYLQPYYQNLGYKLGICSNAEDFYQREISLPLYPAMSEADMNYTKDKVIETLSEI